MSGNSTYTTVVNSELVTKVHVELQFTRNLGNFENIRVAIGIEDHVRHGETTDTATERVYKFVENKLIEKVQEMESELNGKRKR